MIFNRGLETDARCKTQDTRHEEKLDADFADFAEDFVDGTGGDSGKLDNGGEKIQLSMPGDLDEGVRQYIRIDRVNYSDGSHPEDCPGCVDHWLLKAEADGGGKSLSRIDLDLYGNDPDNWQAAPPSPGLSNPP